MRTRRVLFTGFVARMEYTRLSMCVIFRQLVGVAGCVWGKEKSRWSISVDDLGAFGLNADQRITTAQDEGKWRKTTEQGAERFMAKWIAAESQGWVTACSISYINSMPERNGNGQGEDSPKHACS